MSISRILVAGGLLLLCCFPAMAVGGLVGYWPLDEGAGAIVDECSGAGMAAEGTALGTPTWVETERGPALAFAGNGSVRLDHTPALDVGDGALTISLWVKLEPGASGAILEHYFGGIAGRWGLIAQGAPVMAVYDDARKSHLVKCPGFRLGMWEHLTVVWRRANDGWIKTYVNGQLAQEKTGITAVTRHPADLHLGSVQHTHQFLNGGAVRELAVFDRALTDAEVARLHAEGVPLSAPVVVSSVKTDKILYATRDTGMVTARVKNVTPTAQTVDCSLVLVSWLRQTRLLAKQTLTLPPKSLQTLTVPLAFAGERYGCEVRAVVMRPGAGPAEKRQFFSVADNFFDVGIGSDWGGALQTANGKSATVPASARKLYSNYFELFFWSPCDWALHVAPQAQWWSGQASYPEDEQQLTNLIEASHAQGVKVAFYASGNPAGPFGWEVARRHPDWFGGGGFGATSHFNAEALDHWNDPAWRKTAPPNPGWFVIKPDLRRLDALDYGIDRIIDSVQRYQWDAVRFDGHYTILNSDPLSTRNMRRLKERVWARHPGFRLGFNYGRAPEWLGVTHEMREAMAGGGMYLQEGIRNWRYTNDQYQRWSHYAANELRIAKMIQAWGGSYHCMWSDQRLTPAQAYYKLVYGLIAGGHPADSGIYDKTPGSASWGAFMTRWSAFLWHGGLRAAPEQAARFQVSHPAVRWRELVQECVVSPTRKYVVLHLVNPPIADEIAQTAFPEPLGAVTVRYTPEAGTKVVGSATLARPDTLPFDLSLPPASAKDGLTVAVPGVAHWVMLIWEVEGRFAMPAAPPAFTAPPDPAQLTWSPDERLVTRIDPNREDDVQQNTEGDDAIVSLATGGVNIGRVTVIDSDSPQGSVQWRNPEKPAGNIGKFYTGPYAPGRYQCFIRVKWADPADAPTPQMLTMRVLAEKGQALLPKTVTFVTPGHPRAPADAIVLGEKGRYRTYAFGTIDIKAPEYFSFAGQASTDKVGPQTLYAEQIVVRRLARYTDADLEQWTTVDKPAGLRTPNGRQPEKVLVIKGLFSPVYDIEKTVACDARYALPDSYEALYAYDALVLCNVDFRTSTFATRRLCKDFVDDGGRLVLLGGNRTLGEGGMTGTYFAALSPFALRGRGEVTRCAPPALLGATAGEPFPDQPALFWQHQLALKPAATALAYAGHTPIAARLRSGKGETVLFAGTVLGEGAPGETPFWQCPSWRTLLTRLIRD
jgi:hypothetical protein